VHYVLTLASYSCHRAEDQHCFAATKLPYHAVKTRITELARAQCIILNPVQGQYRTLPAMSINHLPNELIILISESLPTPALNALLQTSNRFALVLTPSLHKRALIGDDKCSALHWAVTRCHLPMVRIILNTGTPVSQLQLVFEPVLQSAIHAKDLTILRLLLEAGADTEASPGLAREPEKGEGTALVLCGVFGLVDAARLLLSAGAREREHALRSAAKRGHIEIVKLFLDHNVTIDPSPMCIAAKFGDEKLLNYLMQGASKDQLSLAMLDAIYFGHTNLVRILLDSGADPNYKLPKPPHSSKQDTPLIQLFRRLHLDPSGHMESHVDIVEMLISRGADATFSSHTTAFSWACLGGPRLIPVTDIDQPGRTIPESAYKLLDLFLSAGIEINSPDPQGNTPVHLAVRHLASRQTPIDYLEYFISRGADVNTVNNAGGAPLHKVASLRKDVFMRLIELGADLSISDPLGDAPMMDVANWGTLWPDVLKWYLRRRREGLGFNGISETALLNASRNAGLRGGVEVSKILLAGVNPG